MTKEDMKFEFVNTNLDFRFQSLISYQDNDTMDLDAWQQDDVTLTWGMEMVIRDNMVKDMIFYVPDQTIMLKDNEEVEIKNVLVEHSPADFEFLSKIGIKVLVLDKGQFMAHL